MANGGPIRGRAQRGNEVAYDLNSGRPYRTSVSFDPFASVKLIKAARAARMSVGGLINELVRRMPLDEAGRPVWADELDLDDGRQPLPLLDTGS